MLKPYLRYLWQAKNAYGLHSPFVFELYNNVINSKKRYYAFNDIEKLRQKLLSNHQIIQITDFGAGSRVHKSNQRKISQIAKYSAGSHKEGKFLFRLINHFKPQNIFELGTSLGVSTLYMASVNSQMPIYTFEGCPNTAKIAKENFDKFQKKNIHLIVGELEKTLENQLNQLTTIDFAFLDANHRFEPTLHYFELFLRKINENSILVFDDIHWSTDMEKAWEEIKAHPKVSLTIDLFHLGLVFFRQKQEKQNFILKF